MHHRRARASSVEPAVGPNETILLVESDPAMAKIALRELRARQVIWIDGVAKALRTLDRARDVDTIVSAYKLTDGTAQKLFLHTKQRRPHIRRVLYIESNRVDRAHSRLAMALADVVVTNFGELQDAVL